jgi:hypothetical protein
MIIGIPRTLDGSDERLNRLHEVKGSWGEGFAFGSSRLRLRLTLIEAT